MGQARTGKEPVQVCDLSGQRARDRYQEKPAGKEKSTIIPGERGRETRVLIGEEKDECTVFRGSGRKGQTINVSINKFCLRRRYGLDDERSKQ